MSIKQIQKLSDEEIAKLSESKLREYLGQANREAEKRRKKLISKIEENPDLPEPQIFRDYKGRHNGENWREYKFEIEDRDNKSRLRHKLVKVVGFLNAKTLDYDKWEEQLQDFADRVVRKYMPRDSRGRFTKKLAEDTYKQFWILYNKVLDRYNFHDIGFKYNPTEVEKFTPASYIWERFTRNPNMDIDSLALMIEKELREKLPEIMQEEERDLNFNFNIGGK